MRRALLFMLLSCDGDPANPFGAHTDGGPSAWLRGEVYDVDPGSAAIPTDLDARPVRDVVFTDVLDVSPRELAVGFANGRFEWFAVRYRGAFTVARAGAYRFRVLARDGAIVRVDGAVVLDDDGVHAARERAADLPLEVGAHALEVDYLHASRYDVALQLWVTPPGASESLFRRAL